MRARLQIVIVREHSPERGPHAEFVEHRTGDVLNVSFLRLLIRTVGQISSGRVRDGD